MKCRQAMTDPKPTSKAKRARLRPVTSTKMIAAIVTSLRRFGEPACGVAAGPFRP